MPNRARNRGDYLERQTKAALSEFGWIVIRAAGSLGPADLIAIRAGSMPLLVACKTNGLIPPTERAAIREAAERGGARPLLATRTKRGWVDLYLVTDIARGPHVDQIKVPAYART